MPQAPARSAAVRNRCRATSAGSQRRSLQIHVSNNRAPAMGRSTLFRGCMIIEARREHNRNSGPERRDSRLAHDPEKWGPPSPPQGHAFRDHALDIRDLLLLDPFSLESDPKFTKAFAFPVIARRREPRFRHALTADKAIQTAEWTLPPGLLRRRRREIAASLPPPHNDGSGPKRCFAWREMPTLKG